MEELKLKKKTIREDALKKDLSNRLRRIEGQVRGLCRMVEDDAYCDDLLNQIASVRGALQAVSGRVLENHLKNCLVRDIRADKRETLDELLGTIDRMMKGR